MPRKIPLATDWRPLDLLKKGKSIYRGLPRQKIEEKLAAKFPNWRSLDEEERSAVCSVVLDSFLSLIKYRTDQRDSPRIATVKGNLSRVQAALVELTASLKAMDLRTKEFLRKAAGQRLLTDSERNECALNGSPLPADEYTKGNSRIRLLTRALADAQHWTSDALKKVPPEDTRKSAEPGLEQFASDVAHVWENYGGIRFTASKNRDRAPEFVHGILEAAGVECSLARALKAAQFASRNLKRDRTNRLIVARADRDRPLGELLASRGPHPQKGKQSRTS